MKKVLETLDKIEKWFGAIGILLLSLFVILDVLGREVLGVSIPWAQKLSVYLMIWCGFIGPCLVATKGIYLRPQIFDQMWMKKNPTLYCLGHSLICLIFHLFLLYYAIGYVSESFEFKDMNVLLRVPMWFLQAIIPYAFASLSLRNIYYLLNPEDLVRQFKEAKPV